LLGEKVNLDLKKVVEGLSKTDLIYWRDSYIREFESEVLRVVPDKRNAYLVTKATTFHGKTGGQPSDIGTISTASGTIFVVKKVMLLNEVVVHYGSLVKGELDQIQAGSKVRGEINWTERYSAMRKHTAGHLLDHCLEIAMGRPSKTVDSWLGEPCYVTYAGKTPDGRAVNEAVELEVDAIRNGLPVKVDFVSYQKMLEIAKDAPNIARIPESDLMRIVTIEGCKPIPCGGTHVRNTKEIGEFELQRVERTVDGESFRVYFTVK
jgi:Ser-tRNA(Ala) deacylase AlaX